jgi:hypothetical protein
MAFYHRAKEKEAEMFFKSSPPRLLRENARDQIFNLPLPTLVEGKDASGRSFQERTVLFYISHHGASFNMKNTALLGSPLKLIIDLPPSLAEDKSLKLVIRGRIALVEANESSPSKQRVSLRFESRYLIQTDEKN